MKMGLSRNPYLITRAMRNFLLASILTMAVAQVNTTVDGIIVSHLVGPDALSAVNLYMPISLIVTSLSTLFGVSATIVAARAIGERDRVRAGHLLSTALVSVVVMGLLVSVVCWLFGHTVSELVCHEEPLRDYFDSYMTVMMSCAGITMMSYLANESVAIDGHPEWVTRSVVAAAVLNFLLDLLFVGEFGMGVVGSAYATVLSTVFNILSQCVYLYGSRCSFRVNPFTGFSLKSLGENTLQGTPLVVSNLVLALMFLLMNNIIQYRQGVDGIYALSVCVIVLSVCMMFSNGVGSLVLTIGGFLRGQQDYVGLRMLVGRSVGLVFGCVLVLSTVIALLPGVVTMLFGADTPGLMLYANRVLRIFVPMLPFVLLALTLANIYQMLGYMVLSVVIVAAFPLVLVPSLVLWPALAGNDAVWYAFPSTGVLVVVVAFLVSETVRKKKGNVDRFTLIPVGTEAERNAFNISVRRSEADVSHSLNDIRDYLASVGVGEETAHDVVVCLRVLLLNIVGNVSRNRQRHYIDIHIRQTDGQLMATVKDDGRPFTPAVFKKENHAATLNQLKAPVPKIDYQYMYGQNMTFLKWKI